MVTLDGEANVAQLYPEASGSDRLEGSDYKQDGSDDSSLGRKQQERNDGTPEKTILVDADDNCGAEFRGIRGMLLEARRRGSVLGVGNVCRGSGAPPRNPQISWQPSTPHKSERAG